MKMNVNFEEILRGYTSEQYAETLYNTLINYLVFENIIDIKDYIKFSEEHINEILGKIIARDKEESNKALEKINNKSSDKNE